MFSRMYLEITTCCNLSCSFCPGTKRPAAFLSPENFHTLAAKLRPYGEHLYLHVMGEPLLHPQLAEILRSNNIRSVTVLRMEVPCCGGLEMAARRALEQCGRDLPWQVCTVHIDGTVTKN